MRRIRFARPEPWDGPVVELNPNDARPIDMASPDDQQSKIRCLNCFHVMQVGGAGHMQLDSAYRCPSCHEVVVTEGDLF